MRRRLVTSLLLLTATTFAQSPLQPQLEVIAAEARGRVGVAARIVEGGELITLRGQEQFPMQSVYKFPIGMAILNRVDQGKLALNQRVRVSPDEYISPQQRSPIRDQYPKGAKLTVAELLRYAVSESDGSASDVLLRLVGGPAEVMQYLKSLGVTGLQVRDTEKALGGDHAVQYRNWATPEQAVRLLEQLQRGKGLSPASRKLLIQLMTETPTGPRRLKGELPAGTVVTHKTGTSGTRNGVTAATNDVGLITLPDGRHLAVAVFVSDARADDATRERVIARVAKTLYTHFTQPK